MKRRTFLKGLVGTSAAIATPALAGYYGIVREPPNYPPVEGDCGNFTPSHGNDVVSIWNEELLKEYAMEVKRHLAGRVI